MSGPADVGPAISVVLPFAVGVAIPIVAVILMPFSAIARVNGLSVAGPVVGGASAEGALTEVKEWLALHSAAVITMLFLVFGGVLVASVLRPLTG